ncbi:sensor histidine kinase [Algoriphagus sp. NG3]|uniref:sensor histidine kinase n=1 Tax=Algoriphagus sp. NG3 TaxID=3097546 RepID=UPI002A7F127C|nr:ATP-binding protein [Algoriphagus sp. NG3]WPR73753.1 ATP-binding protein [Algoriphagus sp. NG3]
MQESSTTEIILTIAVSSIILLIFVCLTIYFFFLQQKKRFQHQQEVLELRESFNQTILQSKLEIQERTLDHIAKELHANFSHLISLININLAAILSQSTGEVREHINETKLLVKELMSEVKALSVSLNSDFMLKAGFNKRLEHELERLKKTKRYNVSYQQHGVPVRLPAGEEIVLYRLCQEILNNIVKHAEATSISVELHYSNQLLYLSISDDGVGFDKNLAAERALEKESTGLLNIAGRAKFISADLQIKTMQGIGTVVDLKIPLTN